MPHVTGPRYHRANLEVLGSEGPWLHGESRVLLVGSNATYPIALDSDNRRLIYAGMLVAEDSTATYWVPYSAGASYGTGTDTAVGIVREFHDATLGDPIIEPIIWGKILEKHCFVINGTVGTVPAGAKTNLSGKIFWE